MAQMPIKAACPICGFLTDQGEAIIADGAIVPIIPGVSVKDAWTQEPSRLIRFDLPCGHSAGGYYVNSVIGVASWTALIDGKAPEIAGQPDPGPAPLVVNPKLMTHFIGPGTAVPPPYPEPKHIHWPEEET